MGRVWNKPGIPHKDWKLTGVIDIKYEGKSYGEYEICQMCDKEQIRFVHLVHHPLSNIQLRVGSVCSKKMTGDAIKPKELEEKQRKLSSKLDAWLKKEWSSNVVNMCYMTLDGHILVIVRQTNGKYRCKLDSKFGQKEYDNLLLAKIGMYEKIEHLKTKNSWVINTTKKRNTKQPQLYNLFDNVAINR